MIWYNYLGHTRLSQRLSDEDNAKYKDLTFKPKKDKNSGECHTTK